MITNVMERLIDFTRTSGGGYFGPDGLFRFTPASRNLLLYTQEFDVSAWSKAATVAYPFDPALATYGPELITNGGFSDGTTGWSGNANSTLSVVSGALRVTAVANGIAYASQGITTVPGRGYFITMNYVTDAVTGNAFLYARTSAGSGDIANYNIGSTLGAHSLYFVATGTTTFISVSSSSSALAGEYLDFDNISVREVTTLGLLAPDSTLTADAVLPTATTAAHNVQQSGGGSGATLTLSTYAKAGSHAFMQLSHGSLSAIYANFNLLTGEVGAVGANATASIVPAGDGWYRCTMTFMPTYPANLAIGHITSATAGHRENWAATGTESIYVWGAQLEAVPDANLVLGSELRSSGAITVVGTITAGSYNTSTGEVVLHRVDASNLNQLTFASTSGKRYLVDIENTGSSQMSVRSGATGLHTIPAGQRLAVQAIIGAGQNLVVWADTNPSTATATIHSVKEITGTTGMPTDYTRNHGGLYPPRFDYDPVTLAPRGLLIEEQRTNLLTRSEEFENGIWSKASATITANAAVSPDGTANAGKLVEAAANAAHYALQDIGSAIPDNTTFTAAVYVKAAGRTEARLEGRRKDGLFWSANFDLSAGTLAASSNVVGTPTIEPVGDGWFRISASATSSAGVSTLTFVVMLRSGGALTYLGDGTSGIYVWGAQLEAGAFPTSYIPTAASQVTRAADVAVITGANFSRWYNQSEGTFVAEFDCSGSSSALSADDATNNNFIRVGRLNTTGRLRVFSGGAEQADAQPANGAGWSGSVKVAGAFKANDFAASASGGTVTTDAAGSVPAITQLRIGTSGGGDPINGHVRRIRFYPTRLSNAQLQALTV